MIKGHNSVLSDPMNGCPEDFAEDYAPIEDKQYYLLLRLGTSEEAIAKAHERGYERFQKEHIAIFGED